MSVAVRASRALAFVVLASFARAQSVADQTGLTALIARLGAGNQPTGAAVRVGQVEAPAGGYMPDASHPEFAGKTFNALSPGSAVSGHATAVGQYYYGSSTGIAPGPAVVDCWEASHWLMLGFLNGSGSTPPLVALCKVMNHSWIGSTGDAKFLLRKLDYAVQTQGLLMVCGVNNGTGPLDVPLLSHSYNGIAVGRSDGQHHAGGTLSGYDIAGRQKPEIVAPAGATSFSTPLISGACALLVETARTHPSLATNPEAERPEVVKAVLLAGATHRAGWTNGAATSGPTRGDTITPLDLLWGVDQVDVNRSHWILTGGVQTGASTLSAAVEVAPAGWEAVATAPGASQWWRFDVEAAKPFVSVLATWNRQVAPSMNSYTIPDLDLELWRVDAGGAAATLIGDPGLPYFTGGNVSSTSTKQNVEHLYVTGLAPGEYALELRRKADAFGAWTVAVAWEVACPAPIVYGTGKITSLGAEARLSYRGVPSESVDDFHLAVRDAIPDANGIVFYGSGQANVPFYGGRRWVSSPVTRTPIVQLDAQGELEIDVDLDPSEVGLTRCYQFWFRDAMHPDGTGIGLTNAVQVQICH
jgi:hypothetical protein